MTSDLQAIRSTHGGTVYDGGRRWVGPGPGHSKRDNSLSVLRSESGRLLIHSFAGDPFDACAKHLGVEASACEVPKEEWRREKQRAEEARRTADREATAFCRSVWADAVPITATPAARYLASRGLVYGGTRGDALRWGARAPRGRASAAGTHPAMVAAVSNAAGAPCGLHLTYLTADGSKAFGPRSRLMFGRVGGGAVRLMDIGPDRVLAVGEGIETAGAFAVLHGVPTWAALSTSGLVRFELPCDLSRLIIAADSDDSGAGIAAARTLADRLTHRCPVVIVAAPPGQDWADVLMGASHD